MGDDKTNAAGGDAAAAKAAKADAEIALYWIDQLEQSERWQLPWVQRSDRIVLRYRNERPSGRAQDADAPRRFAILWSNIQVLGPAVYARKPQPVVTRRFKDADPVGRYASEVLERGIAYTNDRYDFDDKIKLARDDFLLLGRGQVWARYVPFEQTAAAGGPAGGQAPEESDQITSNAEDEKPPAYAELDCDHLSLKDFGMGPCREWSETPYVWRRAYMDRKALKARFGNKLGAKIPLDWTPKDDGTGGDALRKERAKKAAVYEIWDKATRRIFWMSKGYPIAPLDVKDDWLGLEGFFPCPRPLMATTPPDNYLPIPDYVYYQDQAEELDELTVRIGNLTDALRMVGVYDASNKDTLANMFNGTGNTLIPVESMAAFADKGGMRGVIEWMPIDIVASTLAACFETRTRILDDIYQITGISDIVRGDTDPDETATAQNIKSQWGSLRVRDRQKELARFARDLIEIEGEIIAKKFPVETLKTMTDVKLLTAAEKAQVQQAQRVAQSMQAAGAPPQALQALQAQLPPDAAKLMNLPSWEDVDALLKNDAVRSFRIDIETDSTIEPNETEEKQRRVEFVTAIGELLAASLPVVQAAPPMAALVAETVKFLARGFRVGREMEDVIERTFDQIAQMPPGGGGEQKGDPYAPQTAQLEMQTEQIKQQGELQKTQLDAQMQQAEMPIRMMEVQAQQYALQRDPQPQATANGPNGSAR